MIPVSGPQQFIGRLLNCYRSRRRSEGQRRCLVRIFKADEPEGLVLRERSTRGYSSFMLEKRSAACRIAQVVDKTGCRHVAAAEVSVGIAMEGICALFGDNVQDDPPSLSIFPIATILND